MKLSIINYQLYLQLAFSNAEKLLQLHCTSPIAHISRIANSALPIAFYGGRK